MAEPLRLLERPRGGWVAFGCGWAVDGATKDEALERWRMANLRHAAIRQQPYLWERDRAWEWTDD